MSGYSLHLEEEECLMLDSNYIFSQFELINNKS